MTSKFAARMIALVVSVAVSVDQAFAMAWPWFPGKDHGHSGPAAAPELDGPGGIAAIAFLVSVALVLFNRSRNR
jgi:hypothetical protein